MMFYTEKNLKSDLNMRHNIMGNMYDNVAMQQSLSSLSEEKFKSRRKEMRNYSSSGDSYQIADIFYKEQVSPPPLQNTTKDLINVFTPINDHTKHPSAKVADQLENLTLRDNQNQAGPAARSLRKGLVNALDPNKVSFQEESEWLETLVQNEVEIQRRKKLNEEKESSMDARCSSPSLLKKPSPNGEIISRSVSMPYIPSTSTKVEEVPIKFEERKQWLEVLGKCHVNSIDSSGEGHVAAPSGKAFNYEKNLKNGSSSKESTEQCDIQKKTGEEYLKMDDQSLPPSIKQRITLEEQKSSLDDVQNNAYEYKGEPNEETSFPKMKDALKIFQVIEGSRKPSDS